MAPTKHPFVRCARLRRRWPLWVLPVIASACASTELYDQRSLEARNLAPGPGERVEVVCFSNWLLTNDEQGPVPAAGRVAALVERLDGELRNAVERQGLEALAGGENPGGEPALPHDPKHRNAIEHAWNHFHSYWKAYRGSLPLPCGPVTAEAPCPYTLIWRASCSDSNGAGIFLGFAMAIASGVSGGHGAITATGSIDRRYHMDLMLIHNPSGTVLWVAHLSGSNDAEGKKMDAVLREAMRGFPRRIGAGGAGR